VDLDTHQGDGTASILEHDEFVTILDIHAEKNFPSIKMRPTFDIGLPDKIEDEQYLSILQTNLQKALDFSKPDIVFYLAGVDISKEDRFGRLAISEEGIRQREQLVLELLYQKKGIPVVILTAGGYASTPQRTAELHSLVFREASKIIDKSKFQI